VVESGQHAKSLKSSFSALLVVCSCYRFLVVNNSSDLAVGYSLPIAL
jgi:hypothetical protein